MAQVTYYVALPFRQIDGEITAGESQECRDAFKARSVAAILASDPNNCGALAFSRTGDPALGEFDDAVIITRLVMTWTELGRHPTGFHVHPPRPR
jgi:hypothetical protein